MHILITTDTVGGVWTFTSELTQHLLSRGHSLHLVSFGRQPSAEQQAWADQQGPADQHRRSSLPPTTRHLDRSAQRGAERPLHAADSAEASSGHSGSFTYTPTDIPLEWMQDNENAFAAGQSALFDALQQHPTDLILSNQFCFGRLDTSIPRIVVAHSDVLSWAHACKPSALEPSPWLNRYTSPVQAGLLDAAAVITPTAWMGKALTTNFFLPRNYYVVPNGVSVGPASDPPPPRKFQAITAGRLWDEAKGLDSLSDLDSPIPLLVAGDNALNAAGPEIPWPTHLTNLGSLSRSALHEHFRQSAVYLCTSRYEPFGLAPLEAALCGCALVLRDLPSLREVWADSALYFTDNASLSHILHTLAADRHLLFKAQARAYGRAQHFTPERMADSYLDLFQSILQHPHTIQHVA